MFLKFEKGWNGARKNALIHHYHGHSYFQIFLFSYIEVAVPLKL